jgi:predicted PolB exonuclease-like 3'-5' exonuclease
MGWYYYLEERLKVPFNARCKSKREISSSPAGEIVLDVQQWQKKKLGGFVARVVC